MLTIISGIFIFISHVNSLVGISLFLEETLLHLSLVSYHLSFVASKYNVNNAKYLRFCSFSLNICRFWTISHTK